MKYFTGILLVILLTCLLIFIEIILINISHSVYTHNAKYIKTKCTINNYNVINSTSIPKLIDKNSALICDSCDMSMVITDAQNCDFMLKNNIEGDCCMYIQSCCQWETYSTENCKNKNDCSSDNVVECLYWSYTRRGVVKNKIYTITYDIYVRDKTCPQTAYCNDPTNSDTCKTNVLNQPHEKTCYYDTTKSDRCENIIYYSPTTYSILLYICSGIAMILFLIFWLIVISRIVHNMRHVPRENRNMYVEIPTQHTPTYGSIII